MYLFCQILRYFTFKRIKNRIGTNIRTSIRSREMAIAFLNRVQERTAGYLCKVLEWVYSVM